jgi:hypothetical protein
VRQYHLTVGELQFPIDVGRFAPLAFFGASGAAHLKERKPSFRFKDGSAKDIRTSSSTFPGLLDW